MFLMMAERKKAVCWKFFNTLPSTSSIGKRKVSCQLCGNELTYHGSTSSWNRESIVLGTKPLSERHTSENIVKWIEEMIGDFSIATDKVTASMIVVLISILVVKYLVTSMDGTLKPVLDIRFNCV